MPNTQDAPTKSPAIVEAIEADGPSLTVNLGTITDSVIEATPAQLPPEEELAAGADEGIAVWLTGKKIVGNWSNASMKKENCQTWEGTLNREATVDLELLTQRRAKFLGPVSPQDWILGGMASSTLSIEILPTTPFMYPCCQQRNSYSLSSSLAPIMQRPSSITQ